MNAERGTVFVTGASSGIGHACVLRLSESGFRVFAGVRTESAAAQLNALGRPEITPLQVDLTKDDEIATAAAILRQELAGTGLAGLVNNAGTCVSGPLEYISPGDLRTQFEVNVIGQVAVTQAVLPLLRLARGRIVNMGSTSGRIASRFNGPYCASKFAMEAITSTLRLELQSSGVNVVLIEPGVVGTPLWRKVASAEQRLLQLLPDSGARTYGAALSQRADKLRQFEQRGSSADAVCRAVLHALTARMPKLRYIVGTDARIRTAIAAVLPEKVWYRLASKKAD